MNVFIIFSFVMMMKILKSFNRIPFFGGRRMKMIDPLLKVEQTFFCVENKEFVHTRFLGVKCLPSFINGPNMSFSTFT